VLLLHTYRVSKKKEANAPIARRILHDVHFRPLSINGLSNHLALEETDEQEMIRRPLLLCVLCYCEAMQISHENDQINDGHDGVQHVAAI